MQFLSCDYGYKTTCYFQNIISSLSKYINVLWKWVYINYGSNKKTIFSELYKF